MATTMMHDEIKITIKINPDCPTDPNTRWTAFAFSEGVALPKFAGKSWKTEEAACKAARKWLYEMAERHVTAPRSGEWKSSTQDDVLTH